MVSYLRFPLVYAVSSFDVFVLCLHLQILLVQKAAHRITAHDGEEESCCALQCIAAGQ